MNDTKSYLHAIFLLAFFLAGFIGFICWLKVKLNKVPGWQLKKRNVWGPPSRLSFGLDSLTPAGRRWWIGLVISILLAWVFGMITMQFGQ